VIRRLASRLTAMTVVAAVAMGIAAEAAFSQSPDEANMARLQRALAKARRGDQVTVGVIGGSITQGSNATSADKNYANLVAQWWRRTFPKAEIRLVNAGIGATGSNFGALRAQRDLLVHRPDFVIVEYAVNDDNSQIAAESLEGLIRQVLRQPNQPAVVLLFMMKKGGRNAQQWHEKVGQHYHLPMVSMRDALWPEIEAGRAKWDNYEADDVHPNDRGHAYTANLVTDLLEKVLDQLPPDDRLRSIENLPSPLFSDLFEHTTLFEVDSLKPVNNTGWTLDAVDKRKCWKADKPGSRIEFEIEGRLILLIDYHIRGPMGKVKVQVDERPAIVRDAWYDQTWGGYRATEEVVRDLPPGKHRVTIEVLLDKNPQSTGHEYRIMGLGAAGAAEPAR
jgi:lysophospholipase L1-like esterase